MLFLLQGFFGSSVCVFVIFQSQSRMPLAMRFGVGVACLCFLERARRTVFPFAPRGEYLITPVGVIRRLGDAKDVEIKWEECDTVIPSRDKIELKTSDKAIRLVWRSLDGVGIEQTVQGPLFKDAGPRWSIRALGIAKTVHDRIRKSIEGIDLVDPSLTVSIFEIASFIGYIVVLGIVSAFLKPQLIEPDQMALCTINMCVMMFAACVISDRRDKVWRRCRQTGS